MIIYLSCRLHCSHYSLIPLHLQPSVSRFSSLVKVLPIGLVIFPQSFSKLGFSSAHRVSLICATPTSAVSRTIIYMQLPLPLHPTPLQLPTYIVRDRILGSITPASSRLLILSYLYLSLMLPFVPIPRHPKPHNTRLRHAVLLHPYCITHTIFRLTK